MVQQRRFRSKEERQVIVTEVNEALSKYALEPRELINDLKAFQNDGGGRQFDGELELQELKIKIVWRLPGRRILQQFVRVSKMED
jgi:hypothetical protein